MIYYWIKIRSARIQFLSSVFGNNFLLRPQKRIGPPPPPPILQKY